jgi:hypothetical protein
LAAESFVINGKNTYFYFSAGITNNLQNSIDQQIALATKYMRRAKEAGGQMIVDDGDEDDPQD